MGRKRKNIKSANAGTFSILPILFVVLLFWSIAREYSWQVIILAVISLALYIYYKYSQKETIRKSGINDIDKMDGKEFEKKLNVYSKI